MHQMIPPYDETRGILIVSLIGALAIVAVLSGCAVVIARLIIQHRERMAMHRERLAMIGMGQNPDQPLELSKPGHPDRETGLPPSSPPDQRHGL